MIDFGDSFFKLGFAIENITVDLFEVFYNPVDTFLVFFLLQVVMESFLEVFE